MPRRLLIAVARAAALFVLVAGIYAAAAVALPQTAVLSRAIVSVLAGVLVYELLRRPRRAPVVSSEIAPADNSAELQEAQYALRQLRLQADAAKQREGDLEAARMEESETRKRIERDAESLKQAAARAVEEIQRVRTANDELRGQLVAQRASTDEVRTQLETQRKANDEIHAQIEKHRSANDELRRHIHKQRTAHDQLQAESEKNTSAVAQELEALRADRQRARREVEEAKQKAEVEKAAHRKTIDAEWAARFKDTERDLHLTRESAQKLLQSNETLKQQIEEERHRTQAELERMIGESKTERDEMQAESQAVAARLQELVAQLDRERQLSREMSATRGRLDEENAALKKAREAGDAEIGALRGQIADALAGHEKTRAESQTSRQQLVHDLEHARAEALSFKERMEKLEAEIRWRVEAESSEKLQTIVSHMASDHEADVGRLMEEREAARAEARLFKSRIEKLDDESEKFQTVVSQMAGDHEARHAELARELEDARARLGKVEADSNERLQTIVSHMASDHEAVVGKLTQEREEAKAEVRSLKARIEKLEGQPAKRVDEKAIRNTMETEFSEKLQTIVSHMASDHETDVGNLMEEREAARAEVRNLNKRINSLQARLRDLEAPAPNAPTQPMAALKEPPAEEQTRADVLQFAEQAFEAYRKATAPGTEPLPEVEEKRPRILIVHHDPALRMMWRDNLTNSGFDVNTASDGQQGLRMIAGDKPDVVIADVSMPKMSGSELCHLIKSNPETADVKVVLMTGVYTNEVPMDMATKQYAADELLRKPVRIDAMKAALTSILAKAS